MLNLKIAPYKEDAQAPVVFMIDDIANVSIQKKPNTKLKVGEDWGQYGRDKNSMWDFLSTKLLKKFPHLKVTFFLVTDKRAPMALGESYSHNEAINHDIKFQKFLHFLDTHPNVELAYHGTTHGIAFEQHEDFLQEWETFKSLEEAVEETQRGKELFKSVLGHYPTGGKYCGYAIGDFGDQSIAQSQFTWWCHHWDGILWDKGITDATYSYDLSLNHGVVDIPTTVDASTLSLKMLHRLFSRKYLKSWYLYLFKGKRIEEHIESLYENGQVIAIQEHTSPYRTDGITQYPNIVSDIANLKHIFRLLSKKDVWYATCNELAEYYLDRQSSQIRHIYNDTFMLENPNTLKGELTLTMPYEEGTFYLYDIHQKQLGKFEQKHEKLYITHPFVSNTPYQIIKST